MRSDISDSDEGGVLSVNILAISDGAFAVDAKRLVTSWNHAAEVLLGVPATEAVGLPCCRLLGALGIRCCRYCPHHHGDVADGPSRRDGGARRAHAPAGPASPVMMSAFLASLPDSEPRIVHVMQIAPVDHLALALSGREATYDATPHPELTEREREILCMLARGCVTHQIARELMISYVTVRNHIAHITAKLGVRTQLQAVAAAAREGLLDG